MNNETLTMIQNVINYNFKESGLLKQAFTRKSYSEENGRIPHNEVLEFYGDKAFEFVIMQKLCEKYGRIGESGSYESDLEEGTLTEIKKSLVCGAALASKIREIKLHNYLLMGKGDAKQNEKETGSVQEDLFEAILGAVAIDSKWDTVALTRVVDRMLNPDSLIQKAKEFFEEYAKIKSNIDLTKEVGKPIKEKAINQLQELNQKGYIGEAVYDVVESSRCDSIGNPLWVCNCTLDGEATSATAESKKAAKKEAAFAMLNKMLERAKTDI